MARGSGRYDLSKSFDERRADFMNRMSRGMPESQPYFPSSKEVMQQQHDFFTDIMKRRRKRMLGRFDDEDEE
jgi:hypothetical protein